MRPSIFATDERSPELTGRACSTACHTAILGETARPVRRADQSLPVIDAGNAELVCASAFAGDLTVISGIEPADILAELFSVPINLLPLLESPEGWTLLASFISGASYRPTVH